MPTRIDRERVLRNFYFDYGVIRRRASLDAVLIHRGTLHRRLHMQLDVPTARLHDI